MNILTIYFLECCKTNCIGVAYLQESIMRCLNKSIKLLAKSKVTILTAIVVSFFSVSSFADFVDSKNEFAVYGATKIY